jgi:hypothetical protein
MLYAARLRHVARTSWGLRCCLKMELLKELATEKKMELAEARELRKGRWEGKAKIPSWNAFKSFT